MFALFTVQLHCSQSTAAPNLALGGATVLVQRLHQGLSSVQLYVGPTAPRARFGAAVLWLHNTADLVTNKAVIYINYIYKSRDKPN
jgi:hypothetical protein